jgi:glutamate dehydrogenase/leucine dehydrogenase
LLEAEKLPVALAAADGAHLLVADLDRTRRAHAEALGAHFLDPDDLFDQSLDLLVPASLGGVLTAEVSRRLRSRAVVGPANNQLAAPEVADLLHQRGVLWAPDELVGAGGVTYALLRERHGADHDTAMGRVTGLATTLADALRRADAEGTTPTEICARIVDERLGSGSLASPQHWARSGALTWSGWNTRRTMGSKNSRPSEG